MTDFKTIKQNNKQAKATKINVQSWNSFWNRHRSVINTNKSTEKMLLFISKKQTKEIYIYQRVVVFRAYAKPKSLPQPTNQQKKKKKTTKNLLTKQSVSPKFILRHRNVPLFMRLFSSRIKINRLCVSYIGKKEKKQFMHFTQPRFWRNVYIQSKWSC